MANERMTFTLVGRDELSQALRRAGGNAGRLKKELSAVGATAALPAAAAGASALAGIAQAAAAAGVAIGVFGAAIAPQAKQIGEVSKAQKKYQDAVAESGAASADATKAEAAYLATVKSLPNATQESAAAFMVLRDAYKGWSDSLAGNTMPVLTHSFQALAGVLPKLSPLVRDTGDELDRTVSILAGGLNTSGFDRVIKEFSDFAAGSLHDLNNGLVHLMRVGSSLDLSPVSDFLNSAKQYGPLAADTLKNVAEAALKLLSAGGDLGSVMLHAANALAKVVNSIPADALSTMLQLYAAFRLVALGGAAWAALAPRMVRMGRALTVMGIEASMAGGALAGLRAAFMALSTAAKVSVVVAALAAAVIVIKKLSDIGKDAPPNVDKLSTSLKELGRSGKVAGESARVFGKDFSGLADALAVLNRDDALPSFTKSMMQFVPFISETSLNTKDATEKFEGLDSSLASLVKGGHADIAAAALRNIITKMKAAGKDTTGLRGRLDDYKSALADMKLEQKLAADSMGLFGQQAQKTQEKLDAQKRSADGLLQSIEALNDVHRKALGGMIGFEQAIDDTAKAAKENAGALKVVDGHLDLNSQKSRDAASALVDLAAKTRDAAVSAREAGKPWSEVSRIYSRGRDQLMKFGKQIGLEGAALKKFVDYYAAMPDKTVLFKGNINDLDAKIKKGQAHVDALKQKRKVAVGAEKHDLDKKVAAAQRKLDNLRQKRAAAIQAKDETGPAAASANRHLASVHDKTVTITMRSIYTGKIGRMRAAHGGPVPGYAAGGSVQALQAGGYVRGPGTTTSDSILGLFSGGTARVADREYVIQAQAVRKYGVGLFDALNEMRVQPARPSAAATGASGGATTHNTWNVYPQQVSFTAHDLEAMQQRADIRARVGRAR